ncbi:MAG TPA: cell division protein ZapE [Caulobacteraceae bacterium]|nr:cell division protein ZapE [Caulobacteraceae bacterium]
MPGHTRAAYEVKIAAGEIQGDPAQAAALEALARVEADLSRAPRPGLFRKPEGVRGAYIWGPVGRGKSMLMDLFFAAAPTQSKQRLHFHVFMAQVHRLVAQWRGGDAAARRSRFGTARGDDPIPPVADVIAAEGRLLCFDEFQVTDIADAMILGRLFEALFERGVSLVATSNRPPWDLYKDGLNRQLFVPFIEMIASRLEVVEVPGERDYRVRRLRAAGTWFSPDDPDNRRAFDHLWRELLDGVAEAPTVLEVLGRREAFARAAGGMLRVTFEEACVHPRGPEDYLALADRFHTVFLEGVPRLRPEKRNEARRLATLIDALYEARSRLAVLAQAEPGAIYPAGEQAFEFERAASRLEEMRSEDWLAAVR